MNPDVIEPVLVEMLEELKLLKVEKEKDAGKLEALGEKFQAFHEKIELLEVRISPSDLSPIEQKLTTGIRDLNAVIAAKPQNIIREFHFHLFPKLNVKEYYQTYSRLVLYLVTLSVALGVVDIGVEWIEGYNRRQEELLQISIPQSNKQTLTPPFLKKGKSNSTSDIRDTINRKHKLKPHTYNSD